MAGELESFGLSRFILFLHTYCGVFATNISLFVPPPPSLSNCRPSLPFPSPFSQQLPIPIRHFLIPFSPFFFLSITGKVKSGEIKVFVIRTKDAAGGCACFHLCICLCCSGGGLEGERDRRGKKKFIFFIFKKKSTLYMRR